MNNPVSNKVAETKTAMLAYAKLSRQSVDFDPSFRRRFVGQATAILKIGHSRGMDRLLTLRKMDLSIKIGVLPVENLFDEVRLRIKTLTD